MYPPTYVQVQPQMQPTVQVMQPTVMTQPMAYPSMPITYQPILTRPPNVSLQPIQIRITRAEVEKKAKEIGIEDDRKLFAFKPSVTIDRPPWCGCLVQYCWPRWEIRNTLGDRDVDPDPEDKLFNLQPISNICCLDYSSEIQTPSGKVFLKTQRQKTVMNLCLKTCLCGMYKGPEYHTDIYKKGEPEKLGWEQEPIQCCILGRKVYMKDDQEPTFYIEEKRPWFLRKESIVLRDVWNGNKDVRIGHIMNISRRSCPLICFCCGGVHHWTKIQFPANATPDEKTMLIAAITNRAGEEKWCCVPINCSDF